MERTGCRLRGLAALVLAGSLATVPSAVSQKDPARFTVGFADDLPKELGATATDAARALGATSLRLTTRWSPGAVGLDSAEAARLDRALAAASGLRVFLSVYGPAGASAPRDAASRESYCGFVRDLLLRYGSVRDVVIWNEPNTRLFWNPQLDADGGSVAPAAYQALLARCYDVLHSAIPGVRVIGLALSGSGDDDAGSHSPGAFIRRLGDAYRASGRALPLFDAVAHHPYPADTDERPWTRHVGSGLIGQGDWNKLMHNLQVAFGATGQPLPGACAGEVCPVIWYLESGFQTTVDEARAGSYTGRETEATLLPPDAGGEPDTPPPPAGSPAPDQRTQVTDAVRLAACQPHVAGILNFLLADEPRLEGWQSGALWADGAGKPSAAAFRAVFAEAGSGRVDCAALKGGVPSSDYEPPAAPGRPVATVLPVPLRVELRWAAVPDPSAPVAYRVYRNGAHVATTPVSSWTDRSVAPGAPSRYAVRVLDAAGNLGDASAEIAVEAPAPRSSPANAPAVDPAP